WAGPFSFGIGYYSGGDIPTLYATPATSADVACTPPAVITIDVPVGYQISNINVQYDMTAWGGAWMSEQRSALYSPTINAGEATISTGAGTGAGTFSYDRNTSFANGATGSVDFVLKAWRTWGGSDCGTTYNYVNNNTWIITPTFELLPACPTPLGLTASNITLNSAELSWMSSGELFDIEWGLQGFALGSGTLVNGVYNSHTLNDLTAETYYQYYVRQSCGADGESTWAGPYTFYTGYCQVTSTYTGNRIEGFSTSEGYTNINNLNNGTENAYSNFSSLSVTQSEGGSFNYAVNVPSYTDIEIWIDYNNNMVFDTDELVAAHVYETSATTFTGTISLPASIDDGDYRIRVRSRYYWQTVASPCGNITYGEAEDYTLTIIPVPACLPPSGLTATPTSLTEVTLGWTSLGDNFDLEWGPSGFTLGDGTQMNGLTSNSTSVTVTIDTPYQFYVRQDCGVDGESIWAGPFNFQTGYCTASSTYTSDVITSFETTGGILNISNNTGTTISPGGYGNFTNLSVAHYETGTINFTTNFNTTMGLNIWVDWNNNGTFEEIEKVYASGITGNPFSGSFEVPADTPLGDYRMRVRAQWGNSDPLPCGDISWGE